MHAGVSFEQLQGLYPNSIAGFKIVATAPPTMHVYGGDTARFAAEGTVMFFVDELGLRIWLFTLRLSVSGEMSVKVNGSRILFDINYIE